MPRKYLDDVESSKLRVDDQDINSDAVEQAYTDEIASDNAPADTLGLE